MPNIQRFGGISSSADLTRINTYSGTTDYSANRNNVTIEDDITIGFFMITDSNTSTDGTKESDMHINSISTGSITKVFYGRAKHNWSTLYNSCWIYKIENCTKGSILKFTIGDNNGMHLPISYSIFKLA